MEVTSQARAKAGQPKKGNNKGRRPNYHAIHRNSLPVQIHPLPPLIPHNPLSLAAIALSYLIQVLAPPKRDVYKGYFSSATSSIHITDHETQRALWEQGFFGRGSLSRSEPTWLENRKQEGSTAEENTDRRRKERRNFKIERAKIEQAEIERDMSENKHTTPAISTPSPESIPRSVPSSADVVKMNDHNFGGIDGVLSNSVSPVALSSSHSPTATSPKVDVEPILPPKLLDLRDEEADLKPKQQSKENSHVPQDGTDSIEGYEEWKKALDMNGLPTPPPTSTCSDTSHTETPQRPAKRLQRQKTVRFSPTIEAREFDLSSPVVSPIKAPGTSPVEEIQAVAAQQEKKYDDEIRNQEHLHISLEEAFFLSYSLGVLNVYPSSDSDDSMEPFSTASLLSLFRRQSYYPARNLSVPAEPDDPFMLSYAAYHHFRAMGWVVRSGIKFGVDYLLYNRGPAFSHADFAVVVIPSYADPYWRDSEQAKKSSDSKSSKSWWWLHGVNRVQAQVLKTLILCYVDVPAPSSLKLEKGAEVDIGALFSKYKVRDVVVKRWTPNRSRD